MRIGIITHNFLLTSSDRQDAGIFLYDFANELSKKAEVFVLCPNFFGEKETYKNIKVTWFDWRGGDRKLGSWSTIDPRSLINFVSLMKSGIKASKEFVKKNKVDFCIAAWALPAGVFARIVKKELDIPYATWSLGSDINVYAKLPILKQLITDALSEADIRFANSYALCRKIKGLSKKECRFLPAITNFRVSQAKILKKSEGKFFFLFVGRLEKVKGPDILIDACNILKKSSKEFMVNIIGDGTLSEKLNKRVQSYGLLDQVRFLGKKGEKEIASFMLASDCLVIASRSESLPLVLIEAARAGLPIIASDVGDCDRLINEYNIGVVVAREDSMGLANKMKSAIKRGKSFKKFYQVGLKRLTQEFSLNQSVNQLIKEIRNIS